MEWYKWLGGAVALGSAFTCGVFGTLKYKDIQRVNERQTVYVGEFDMGEYGAFNNVLRSENGGRPVQLVDNGEGIETVCVIPRKGAVVLDVRDNESALGRMHCVELPKTE